MKAASVEVHGNFGDKLAMMPVRLVSSAATIEGNLAQLPTWIIGAWLYSHHMTLMSVSSTPTSSEPCYSASWSYWDHCQRHCTCSLSLRPPRLKDRQLRLSSCSSSTSSSSMGKVHGRIWAGIATPGFLQHLSC
eukprot:2962743-Amphidinium_carterae.3